MKKNATALLTLAGVALLGSGLYAFEGPSPLWPRWMEDGIQEMPFPAVVSHYEFKAPALNFRETPKAYVVEVELPGMKKEDISVSIQAGVLTISGERKASSAQDDPSYKIRESSYGSVSRSLTLPADADPNKVDAQFKDGILTLTVARNEALKPAKIVIK
jgi:HSP20 family protein